MRKTNVLFFCLLIVLFLNPGKAYSQKHYTYTPDPDTPIYFGHISYLDGYEEGEGPDVIRGDRVFPETGMLNFPIAPGDIVLTGPKGRCEIQFDTGTIIRLDRNTEFHVETILAQSLSLRGRISNLVLKKGQMYVMYKKYSSGESFQIKTPHSAVKMKHHTIAILKASEEIGTGVKILGGKAYALYGPDEKHLKSEKLKKGQGVTVSPAHNLEQALPRIDADFELWNIGINENFKELHKDKAFIPMPVQKMNRAVFDFAMKFSYTYGEWIWNRYYGYVWRPFLNDHSPPGGTWRPYYYGQWTSVSGQLFWVPDENWGWVPYHLGLWLWDEDKGWLWIPGSAFAPAWVVWDFYYGRYMWWPWAFHDFFLWPENYYASYYGYVYSWLYYDDYGSLYYDWNRADTKSSDNRKKLNRLRKDQLKKGDSKSVDPPEEWKDNIDRAMVLVKRKHPMIKENIKGTLAQVVAVKPEDLHKSGLHHYTVKLPPVQSNTEASAAEMLHESDLGAFSVIRKNKTGDAIRKNEILMPRIFDRFFPGSGKLSRKAEKPVSRSGRGSQITGKIKSVVDFRDWNPDIKMAIRNNVSIVYHSRSNEILCPELGLSSRTVSRSITRSGGGFLSAGGYSGSGSSSGSSSSSSGSPSGSVSGSASTGGGGASSSGSGGIIK